MDDNGEIKKTIFDPDQLARRAEANMQELSGPIKESYDQLGQDDTQHIWILILLNPNSTVKKRSNGIIRKQQAQVYYRTRKPI